MKRGILLLIVFMDIFSMQAQNWYLQNPLPQNNTLNSVHFINDQKGIVVGAYGTILKTTDAGITWTVKPSGMSKSLTSVFFATGSTGVAVGEQVLLHTVDGGDTWQTAGDSLNYNYESVCFLDSLTGIAVGSGFVLRTTNGGLNWTEVLHNSVAAGLMSVCFPGKKTGYASGNREVLIKSTDGGQTWNSIAYPSGKYINYYSIHFYDSLHGCHLVHNLHYSSNTTDCDWIVSTKDGGASWDTIFKRENGLLSSVFGLDQNYIVAVGRMKTADYSSSAVIYQTRDGGQTWETVRFDDCHNFTSVFFDSPTHGTIAGEGGMILTTSNGGISWLKTTSGSTQNLQAICFPDKDLGVGVGENGIILRTEDGGSNWARISTSSNQILNSIAFSGRDTGIIVGYNGTILRTLNEGLLWSTTTGIDTNISLYTVCFPEPTAIYAMGIEITDTSWRPVLLKSFDGGATWSKQYQPDLSYYSGLIHSLHFFDRMNGILVTGESFGQWANGTIYKTTDGGLRWTRVYHDLHYCLYNSFFVDKNIGYVVGGTCYIGCGGVIHKTTDGGITWDTVYHDISDPLNSVWFTNPNTGFSCGSRGRIYKTTDAGEHWIADPSLTPNALLSITSPDGISVYAAGINGTIIKNDEGGIGMDELTAYSECSLSIFPNPAKTNIAINLKYSCNKIEGSLFIYTLWGQELFKQKQVMLSQEIDIHMLPRGIYFVKYTHPQGTEIGKFIKE